jgi:hypothetical protein
LSPGTLVLMTSTITTRSPRPVFAMYTDTDFSAEDGTLGWRKTFVSIYKSKQIALLPRRPYLHFHRRDSRKSHTALSDVLEQAQAMRICSKCLGTSYYKE